MPKPAERMLFLPFFSPFVNYFVPIAKPKTNKLNEIRTTLYSSNSLLSFQKTFYFIVKEHSKIKNQFFQKKFFPLKN